jgi:hypothetical protein
MKLYIPEIGDQLELEKEWSFTLHNEYRNSSLFKKMKYPKKDVTMTFPKGTILQVDRIYIRKGASDYSSLTFYVKSGHCKGARFWTKLNDCNTMECTQLSIESKLIIKFQFMQDHTMLFLSSISKNETIVNTRKVICNGVVLTTSSNIKIAVKQINHSLISILPSKNWGTEKQYYIDSVEYKLQTESGELIGSWKTLSSLKTNIKKYYKNLFNVDSILFQTV